MHSRESASLDTIPFVLPPASFRFTSCPPANVDAIRTELGCSEALAWLLARRGIAPKLARQLLSDDAAADEAALHDPQLLGEMPAAVERIRYAIEMNEQIVVHGDYDADGICATTLLVEALESLDANVQAFLPDRFSNGYGLNLDQVERFARDGIRLLIAVDCGITAVEEVAQARAMGMDVIICDHHRPGETLPDAIIASTRPSTYPNPDICATVVAAKLAQALGVPSTPAQHELEAIATVADCMPLVGENRAIVRRGLRALRSTTRPGLNALINECGLRPRELDADAIGFKLAPRINAVGRISASERGFELLRADEKHAAYLAHAVNETNEERRAIERTITAEAIAQVEQWTPAQRDARIYVVHGRGWHEGVVGIVASRLVERYYRPVIVVADGDPARGSGRSVEGVDLHAAIASCDDVLLRWGGHAQAGGITIDPTYITALQDRLATWGATHISAEQLEPRDTIDAIVTGGELSFELVQEIERLAPFGTGWNRPTFLATDARFATVRPVGADGSHLKCELAIDGVTVPGIAFGLGSAAGELAASGAYDVAVRPSINRFRGVESLQVEVTRVYPPTGFDLHPASGWCATACSRECTDRVDVETVLDQATGLIEHPLASEAATELPQLEPLLVARNVTDLRHRQLGSAHVASMLSAGHDVIALVADVSRRRNDLASVANERRFGARTAVLASERCSIAAMRTRLNNARSGQGPMLAVVDYDTLLETVAVCGPSASIVALDPPMTRGHRDALVSSGVPTYLVWGAGEQRFTLGAKAYALDVRQTLGAAWKSLRDEGPRNASELDETLFGSGEHLPTPSSLVFGLRTLFAAGHLELTADGFLAAATNTKKSASSTR